jgi:hypothetical protein
MSKFFTFNQNNTRGIYDITGWLAHHVIVEADNVREANEIAKGIGIYFEGCESGNDCSCCGDRWYSQWDEEDGTEEPEIYGKPAKKFRPWLRPCEYRIHYKDGKVESGICKAERNPHL